MSVFLHKFSTHLIFLILDFSYESSIDIYCGQNVYDTVLFCQRCLFKKNLNENQCDCDNFDETFCFTNR